MTTNTFKAATLNGGFLPTPPKPLHSEIVIGNDTFRATNIAQRVDGLNIDILVMNEVFTPEARRALFNGLKHNYTFPGGLIFEIFMALSEQSETILENGEPFFLRNHSTKSIARHMARQIRTNPQLTSLEKRENLITLTHIITFVESGLFFAIRKNSILGNLANVTAWNDYKGWQNFANLGFFVAPIALKGVATIDVIGLHLQPFSVHSETRKNQLSQLNDFISADSRNGAPKLKLILGDFNIVGESPEYHETIYNGTALPFSTDLFRSYSTDPGFTWSAENPLTDRSEDRGKNERLDYILCTKYRRCRHNLVTKNVSIERYEIPGYQFKYASDHFGLVLEFEVQPV